MYNNNQGLTVFQFNNETDAKVMIQDVTVNNNEVDGMYLTGTGITVNNANIKNNAGSGLLIGFNAENEITLAGDVTVTNSKYGFATTSTAQGAVYVTGNLISNRNVYGVATFSQDLTVAVGGSYSGKSGKSGSGSITACDNGQYDIANVGPSTFEGTDYTCDMTKTFGTDLPVCKPCHPGCDESSDHSDDGSGRSLGLGDFVAGEDSLDREEYPMS